MIEFKDYTEELLNRTFHCFEMLERVDEWEKTFMFRGLSENNYSITYQEFHDDKLNVPSRHFMCLRRKEISEICDIIFNKKEIDKNVRYSVARPVLRDQMKFQIGDIVKVVKKVDRWGYWTNGHEWESEMDDAIGKEFEVYDFNCFVNSYKLHKKYGSKHFPEESLKLIRRGG